MRRLGRWSDRVRAYRRIVAAERHNPHPPPFLSRVHFVARGFAPMDCATYDLERWTLDHYVSAVDAQAQLSQVQRKHNVCLHDKYVFQLLMQSITDRIAPAFGAIVRGKIVRIDRGEPVADPRVWLLDLIRAHGKVVVKPMAAQGGVGVRVLSAAEDVASVRIGKAGLLVSRFVEQHAYARAIFPQATNTLRLVVMRDDEGVFLPIASHRFGTSVSAPVDSVAQGGLGGGIDVATGAIRRLGQRPSHAHAKVVWHEHHPDTGARVLGVVVPGWHEIVAEILSITERLPFISYIGWDVVVAREGFAIIEGNHNPDVTGMQMHGPLLVDERVKAFYARHGIRVPPRGPGPARNGDPQE